MSLSALKFRAGKTVADHQLFDTLEDLVRYFGKSAPYHIHVMSKGVLSRKVESTHDFKELLTINGDPDDFHFTSYDDGTNAAVSFFRKEQVADFLEEVTDRKLHVLGISSGWVPLFNLSDNLEFESEYVLSKQNGRIESFDKSKDSSKKLPWEGVYYSREQLIALSLYKHLTDADEKFALSSAESDSAAKTNYRQFNQFKVFGLSLMGVIFTVLLVNYFYQNSLNSSIAQLEDDLSVSNSNLALLDRLEQEKSRKEQLVLNAGVNASRFLSFYLDKIGNSVPDRINLQHLEVFPLSGKLKDKRKVEVDHGKIVISGSTVSNEILDDWMEKMDRSDWVDAVELMNYLKDENDRADFVLTLTLSH